LVVDLMIKNNPNCLIVTRGPRTPCGQGSVESANKLVQCVMKSISSKNRLADPKSTGQNSLDKSWQYATATPAERDIAYPTMRLFLGRRSSDAKVQLGRYA
jgi:hypothetical protein